MPGTDDFDTFREEREEISRVFEPTENIATSAGNVQLPPRASDEALNVQAAEVAAMTPPVLNALVQILTDHSETIERLEVNYDFELERVTFEATACICEDEEEEPAEQAEQLGTGPIPEPTEEELAPPTPLKEWESPTAVEEVDSVAPEPQSSIKCAPPPGTVWPRDPLPAGLDL